MFKKEPFQQEREVVLQFAERPFSKCILYGLLPNVAVEYVGLLLHFTLENRISNFGSETDSSG
jgi:hypothetical protein